MIRVPRISIIMSCFNDEPYLAEAIESILSQTFEDFEFIVLDDGSTDGTRGIIRQYDDPRIRLVTDPSAPENRGLAARLNQGMALARADIIARMDGDDVAAPHRLATQIAWLDRHEASTLVSSHVDIIDAAGRPLGSFLPELPPEEALDYLLDHTPPYVHSAVLFRKAAVERLGGYNPMLRMCQDYDLWLRLAAAGGRLEIIPEKLLKLRRHDKSISASGLTNLEMHVLVSASATLRAQGRAATIEQLRAVPNTAATAYARSTRARRTARALIESLRSAKFHNAVQAALALAGDARFLFAPKSLREARLEMAAAFNQQ